MQIIQKVKKTRSRHHTLNKKNNIDAIALWSKSISDDKELSKTGFFTIFLKLLWLKASVDLHH